MKHLYFFLFILSQIGLSAQISPCSMEERGIKNDVLFRIDQLPGYYDLGIAGEDNIWLYTALQSPRSLPYKFGLASEGRYNSFFPGAERVLREPFGKEVYFNSRDGKWYIIGSVSLTEGSIEPRKISYTVPLNACVPTEIGKVTTYQSSFNDGERTTLDITDIKDASGVLYLPDGIFDAYRTKREKRIVRNDIETVLTEYLFTDQLSGELLMIVLVNDRGEPKEIKYKSNDGAVTDGKIAGVNSFLLYPNTGYGEVRLEFQNFEPGNYSFVIFDIIGRELWKTNFEISEDITIKKDLSFLARGTYPYTIIDSNNNRILTRRLAIIKS